MVLSYQLASPGIPEEADRTLSAIWWNPFINGIHDISAP
jgi:hypothetical protein